MEATEAPLLNFDIEEAAEPFNPNFNASAAETSEEDAGLAPGMDATLCAEDAAAPNFKHSAVEISEDEAD